LLWFAGSVASIAALFCLLVFWLVSSESGARWILARVSPMLPQQLSIAAVDGTLRRGLRLRAITWRDASADVSVDQVALHAELWPLIQRRVNVTQLDITGVNVIVSSAPADKESKEPFTLDLPVDLVINEATLRDARVVIGKSAVDVTRLELGGRLHGPQLSLQKLDVETSLGDFDASADAALEGPYPASGEAAWELRLPGQPVLSGQLTLRGDSTSYEVSHTLSAPYEVRTAGQVALTASGVEFSLDNSWKEIAVIAADGREFVTRDGALRLLGNVNEFAFDGTANLALDNLPPLKVNLEGTRNADTVTVKSLGLSSDAGRLQASGNLLISPELSWDIELQATDVDPGFADPRFNGRLDVVATSLGRITGGAPVASARISDIAGTLNDYPVKGTAKLAFSNGVFTVDDAVIAVGDNRANVAASIGKRVSVDATFSLKKLAQLGLDAAGTLTGDIRLVTAADALQLGGTLNGSNLRWQEYSAERLEAKFAVPQTGRGTVDVRVSDGSVAKVSFTAASVSLSGSADAHRLRADLATDGVQARIEAGGNMSAGRWSGTLDDFVINGDPLGEWRLREPARLTFASDDLQLDKACLASTSTPGFACAALDRPAPGSLQFDVSINELPLAALPILLPQGTSISGMIEGYARGNVAERRVSADSMVAIRNFGLGATVDEEDISLRFERASARASVLDNRLNGTIELRLADSGDYLTGNVQVVDIFDPQSPLSGESLLELTDMSLFALLVPDIADPAGRITGNLAVGGSVDAAEFVGELGLADGTFGVRRAGITLTDMNLRLRQTQAGQLALQGYARSGDGQLQIDSETTLSASGGVRSELRIEGENFTLLRLPDWRLNASPSIAMLFDEKATRISGDIRIPEAGITIHEVPTSAVRPSGDVIVHREGQAAPARRRPVFIDVRTILGDDVNLSGFGLQTGLEGAVRINGSSNTTYAASGRVTLRDGKYQAYGQNLDIESGELIFNGPLTNPSLNVRATRTASDGTTAGIRLTGTPTQLRSEVYSEPPLADAEALSYLLTGRPLGNANAEDGDMLNQAAFALGLSSAGNVASRIRNDLGLETLGIQGSAENRQLVAGKRIGDRLLVEYAYGIVDNLGTLLLRYQLNNRLIIESRSGLARTVDLVYSVKKP
jgi:translocation and assembly module TamB